MKKPKSHRSLRYTILLAVSVAVILFVFLLGGLFNNFTSNVLAQTETEYMKEWATTIKGLFVASQSRTAAEAKDFAKADIMAAYVNNEIDDAVFEENIKTFLQAYKLEFMFVNGKKGEVTKQIFHDYELNEEVDVSQGFAKTVTKHSKQVYTNYVGDASYVFTEIVFSEGAAYNLSIVPIVDKADPQKILGTLAVGNMLNNAYFQNLIQLPSFRFRMIPLEEKASTRKVASVTTGKDGNPITSLLFNDVRGMPVELKISASRSIKGNASSLVATTVALLFGIISMLAVAYYYSISHWVLRPLEKISIDLRNRNMNEKTGDGDGFFAAKEYSLTKEFEVLCSSINHMISKETESNISVGVMTSILDGINICIYVSDPLTGKILFINKEMQRVYKLDEKVIGCNCWENLQVGQTERCNFCPVNELKKNPNEPIVWEEISCINGRHYSCTDSMIEWAGGRKVHMQNRIDVTELKKIEENLNQRILQQELMAEITQGFIQSESFSSNVDDFLEHIGRFLQVEKAALSLVDIEKRSQTFTHEWCNELSTACLFNKGIVYGISKESLIYKTFIEQNKRYLAMDSFAKEDLEGFLQGLDVKSLLLVPIYVDKEIWGILHFYMSDEARVWNHNEIQLARMLAATVSGAVSRNIIQKKLLRISAIVNNSPQFITYVNSCDKVEFVNQGLLNMAGLGYDEVMHKNIQMLFDEETKKLIKTKAIPEAISKGSYSFEGDVVRKDKDRRTLSMSVFTIATDDKKEEKGVAIIGTDITEKIELEQKLLSAKDEAEQSNHAKSNFLSRMSHEMRTPMNAIIGMTNIAKAAADIDKKEYCLEKIEEASVHLLGVINDILDMSKIEANKFEITKTDFNLEKLLLRVINVVNFRVEEKNQNLTIKLANNLPAQIVADEQRLAQVITNLLSNAIKFTPADGNIKLQVENIQETNNICMLEFSVKDTGIGINAEQQQRLFRLFEQADGGISRKFGGTGLGLAISKSIVNLMGGEIWVESEIDEGANFIFKISVERGEEEDDELKCENLNWQNLRVLAVDDSEDVLEYFSQISEANGFYCETAISAKKALKKLSQGDKPAFDMIFVDWKMPEIDGIELTRQIKQKYGENIVVIMISAAGWSDIEHEARQAGVDGFVAKPLFASLIINSINKFLGAEKTGNCLNENKSLKDIFAGYSILMAEDIDINCEIIKELLSETGVKIVCAENGAIATKIFMQNPNDFDLILMDIHMPEMDGYEATKEIRELKNISNAQTIPIVAMTANVFKEDIDNCISVGMNDHVGKPIDFEELISKLKKYILK